MKKALLLSMALSILIHQTLYAQSRVGYSEYEDVKTFYKVFGEGKTSILIINGGPGMNSRGFETFAKQLSNRYNSQVIIYDQRGTGKSILKVTNASNVSLDLMIADIEALRIKEGISAWTVFGQSFGGVLASYYAAKVPNVINGLILSSSGGTSMRGLSEVDILGRLTQAELDSFRYWNDKLNVNTEDQETRYKRNSFMAAAYVVDDKFVPQIADRLMQVNMNLNRLVFNSLRNMSFDCSQGLSKFSKPVLIINGDQDIVSKAEAIRTHNLLKNSELKFVKGSSHYGWLDNPKEYFDSFDRLVRRVRRNQLK